MALFGLAHMGIDYGYVLRLNRSNDGGFHLAQTAFLPAEGDALVPLGRDLFAVRSAGRVVVFSPKLGISGLAKCD
jgi:hypothetical protein